MFRLFRKHETDEQVKERLLKLCKEGDYGICPHPMEANVAINELRDFFLGKDWYSSFADGNKPTFSEIVYQIETRCKSKKDDSVTRLPLKDADVAINELQEFFLGEGWYVSMPIGHEQVIAEIVYQIETRYKRLKAN